MTLRRRLVCHGSAILLAFGLVAPVAYMIFDHAPPFILSNGATIPATVWPGGEYQMVWTIVQHRECPGTVYQTITDSEGKVHAMEAQPSLFGTTDYPNRQPVRTVGRPRIMPSGVAHGPATIRVVNTLYCNPFHYLWPITVAHPPVHVTIR